MTTPIAPIRVLAAGSLRHALPKIIEIFEGSTGISVSLSLGPAGLLRERIEGGEAFDLFASANMEHPERLAATGLVQGVTCFSRNRLCIISRADIHLTSETCLDRLSDPSLKIGTSTPGDDPSGDYAFEFFDLVESKRRGLGEALKSRALQLVGGRNSPPLPNGKGTGWLITEGHADVFLSYYSNARLLENDPAFSVVELPAALSPRIDYGLALRNGAEKEVALLRDLLLSPAGQQILVAEGFMAAGAAE